MGGFILPRGCKCSQIKPHAVSLTSQGLANHQAGTITFRSAFRHIVAILPHHGQIPILGAGAITSARLRLTVDTIDMNNVQVPTTFVSATTPPTDYALSVPIALDYAAQATMYYDWPTDVVPLWSTPDPSKPGNIGLSWTFDWRQADGSPYALVTPWTIEFYLLEKCDTCVAPDAPASNPRY